MKMTQVESQEIKARIDKKRNSSSTRVSNERQDESKGRRREWSWTSSKCMFTSQTSFP
jgi:hypothetical protein